MSKFAKIENNVVSNIVVIPDEFDESSSEYLASIGLLGVWIKSPTMTGSEAAVGLVYNSENNMFLSQKPAGDYILDSTGNWILSTTNLDEMPLPPSPPL